MKKIRQLFNLVLSAVIVTLGFGSCVSQQKYQAVQKEYQAAQEEIGRLNAENAKMAAEVNALHQRLGKIEEYKRSMEERKVVYGPRPTEFKKDIDK